MSEYDNFFLFIWNPVCLPITSIPKQFLSRTRESIELKINIKNSGLIPLEAKSIKKTCDLVYH